MTNNEEGKFMQKVFGNFIRIFTLFSLLSAGVANAYGPQDVAAVSLSLPPDWQLVANILSDPSTTIKYQKITKLTITPDIARTMMQKPTNKKGEGLPPSERIETISQRVEAKPVHVEGEAFVMQMGDILSKGLSAKGCETGVPYSVPESGSNFKVWIQVFQCQKSTLTGLQFYIDADPQNIYLITYTDTQYPFTGDSRSNTEDMIKSALKICYGTTCSSVQ
jgi:hypothetical protein